MPMNLTDDPSTFPSTIVVPADTDPRSAESIRTPLQQLANRTAFIQAQIEAFSGGGGGGGGGGGIGSDELAIDVRGASLVAWHPCPAMGSQGSTATGWPYRGFALIAPFRAPRSGYIDLIGYQIDSVSGDASLLRSRIAIYANDPTTNYPGALIAQSADIDESAAGFKTWDVKGGGAHGHGVSAGQEVWIAYMPTGASAGGVTGRLSGAGVERLGFGRADGTPDFSGAYGCLRIDNPGTLPSSWPTGSIPISAANMPLLGVRFEP